MFLDDNSRAVQTGIIEIRGVNVAVVEALIEYFHRGKVENLEPGAVDLFKFANEYKVEPLKAGF